MSCYTMILANSFAKFGEKSLKRFHIAPETYKVYILKEGMLLHSYKDQ